MSAKIKNDYGTIFIDDSVLATVAGLSAMECYGLVGMSNRSAADGLVELLRKEHLTRGVKVETENDSIVISLYIVVQFGTKISVVANNIIEKVRYNIENLTGMKVKKININVEGVRVQK
ncbi:Asp23/Gls24 family envelope stress response protein [Sporosalibacterium faouarense]|uniref:Asp23/Gls24 family envelope stress response protein n=1 Tax=Sporosalibacterium faouarense TaxID=516123 RepID=UPI00141D5018|nr:Asp23/Gls24 family envelope stress response protein [Sporosalibacterium faouarense]MTI47715.1 Asp23/Gls24 family envelope stress response protein [Bacillota bacterium]